MMDRTLIPVFRRENA